MKIKIAPFARPLIVFNHEITDGEINFKVDRNEITDEMFKKWVVFLTKNERLEEEEYELFLAKSGFSINIVEENSNIIQMGFITSRYDREKPGGFIIINVSVDEFLSALKKFMESSDYDYYIVEKGTVKILGFQRDISVSPVRSSHVSPVKTSPVKTSPVKTSPVKTSPVKTSPVKTSPVRSPVKTSPVRSPVKTSPVRSPVKTSPVKTSPVKVIAKPMIIKPKPKAKPVAKIIVKPMSR